MYEEAKKYQEEGFRVIPIQPAELGNPESGKAPLIKWRNRGPLSDPELRRYFLEQKANIGIVTGKEVVIDCDSQEGFEHAMEVCDPTGWIVETGGGGRHLWYRVPEGVVVKNRQKINGLGLDIRGEGGLVVVPPSKHYSGNEYRWRMRETLSEYNHNWFAQYEYPMPANWKIKTSDIEERTLRARRYISKIKSVAGEGGDKALFRAACVLVQRFEMEPQEALEELKIWNHFCADPTWSEERLKYKCMEAYRLRGQSNGR